MRKVFTSKETTMKQENYIFYIIKLFAHLYIFKLKKSKFFLIRNFIYILRATPGTPAGISIKIEKKNLINMF